MSEARTVVGVAGRDAAELADRLAADGLDIRVDAADALVTSDADLIVAAGETAVADVVAAGPTVPILPVEAGAGIRAVPRDRVADLADDIAAGEWTTERHRPFAVTVDGDAVGTMTFDLTLLTAEAARISEYSVVVDGERLDNARADGVVVATAAGSTDYARRVEAPILAPGTGIAVAWIAPFRSDPDRWVVSPSTLALHVERDETAVDLHVDGRRARTIGPDDAVSLSAGDPFRVAVVPASKRRYR